MKFERKKRKRFCWKREKRQQTETGSRNCSPGSGFFSSGCLFPAGNLHILASGNKHPCSIRNFLFVCIVCTLYSSSSSSLLPPPRHFPCEAGRPLPPATAPSPSSPTGRPSGSPAPPPSPSRGGFYAACSSFTKWLTSTASMTEVKKQFSLIFKKFYSSSNNIFFKKLLLPSSFLVSIIENVCYLFFQRSSSGMRWSWSGLLAVWSPPSATPWPPSFLSAATVTEGAQRKRRRRSFPWIRQRIRCVLSSIVWKILKVINFLPFFCCRIVSQRRTTPWLLQFLCPFRSLWEVLSLEWFWY